MRKIILSFFILVICFSISTPYQAHSELIISPEGARNLKKMTQDELTWHANLLKLAGYTLKIDGEISSVPKDSYYEITLPKVSITLSSFETLHIGTVTINAAPGNGGSWLTRVSIPERMFIQDPENKLLADVTIEKQSLAVTWIPLKGIYPQAEAEYKGIRISGRDQLPIFGKIDSLTINSALKSDYDGTWNGKWRLSADNINLEIDGETKAKLSIKDADITNIYDKLDPRKIMANRKHLKDIALYNAQQRPEGKSSFIINLASQMQDIANNVSSRTQLTGVQMNISKLDEIAPLEIAVAEISSETSLKDVHAEKSSVSVINHFNGLRTNFLPTEIVALIPYSGSFEANIQDLPLRKLARIMIDGLKLTLNNPEFTLDDVLSYVPRTIQRAETSISINNTHLKAVKAEAEAQGHFTAVHDSYYGLVGDLKLSIKGLQNINEGMQELGTKPEADAKTSGYAGIISAITMMERITNGMEQPSEITYYLEITREGEIKLNGMNIAALINLGKAFKDKLEETENRLKNNEKGNKTPDLMSDDL